MAEKCNNINSSAGARRRHRRPVSAHGRRLLQKCQPVLAAGGEGRRLCARARPFYRGFWPRLKRAWRRRALAYIFLFNTPGHDNRHFIWLRIEAGLKPRS